MLPEALLLLLGASYGYAQTGQALSIDSISLFNPQSIPNPPVFSVPKSDTLIITVALCSASTTPPRFFVTNGSSVRVPSSAGGQDVFEIPLNNGHGVWRGIFRNSGAVAIEDAGQTTFEIGVSETGPMHEILSDLPLLGDTTSNQALLYSQPFSPLDYALPTYPNYTLPSANSSLPIPPGNTPNLDLRVFTTSNSSTSSIPETGCSLSSQESVGNDASRDLWPRDVRGWRIQWFIDGLSPATNYTAYVIQDGTKVGGPIYFATKTAAFSCPLVFNLPYCPNVAYTVPLPPPVDATAYTAANIPSQVSSRFLSSMANFTVSLTTFACGRDLYSPLVGCNDCEREYRRWLCTIIFTRCGEPSLTNPDGFSTSAPQPTATGWSAWKPTPAERPFSALVPQSTDVSSLRNPTLPAMGNSFMMLLPCLEMCNAVDRACLSMLGFRCPRVEFNAAASYGVGYIDGPDGVEGAGVTGASQDRWGNLWCNGS